MPGKPEQSLLFKAIRWDELEMPPKENDRLTAEQIELVRRWIAAGAPWPDEAEQKRIREAEWAVESNADGVIVKNSGGLAKIRQSGEYTEDEARTIVATGFLRMGPWDNAMVSDAESRQIYLDDLVNAVGQTFLATTMRCFKCHDHKFDPLPTRDYYRMYAAFAGTQMAERPLQFTPEENRSRFAEGKAFVQKMLDHATRQKQKVLDKQETAARAWYAEHKLPYKELNARQNDPDDKKPSRHVGLDYVDEGRLKVFEQDEWIWTRAFELTLGRSPMVRESDRLKKYLTEMRAYHARVKPEPVTYPTKVTRALSKSFPARRSSTRKSCPPSRTTSLTRRRRTFPRKPGHSPMSTCCCSTATRSFTWIDD